METSNNIIVCFKIFLLQFSLQTFYIMNGYYCRYSSCTKKFANSQIRSRHEKKCNYKPASKTNKTTLPTTPQEKLKITLEESRYTTPQVKLQLKIKQEPRCILVDMLAAKNNNTAIVKEQAIDEKYLRKSTYKTNMFMEDEKYFNSLSKLENELSKYILPRNSNDSIENSKPGSELIKYTPDTNNCLEYDGEQSKQSHNHLEEGDSEQFKRFAENELYCASLVTTIDRLDPKKQRLAKIRIQQLLFELEYDL